MAIDGGDGGVYDDVRNSGVVSWVCREWAKGNVGKEDVVEDDGGVVARYYSRGYV